MVQNIQFTHVYFKNVPNRKVTEGRGATWISESEVNYRLQYAYPVKPYQLKGNDLHKNNWAADFSRSMTQIGKSSPPSTPTKDTAWGSIILCLQWM